MPGRQARHRTVAVCYNGSMTLRQKIVRAARKVSLYRAAIAVAERRIKHFRRRHKGAVEHHHPKLAERAGKRERFWYRRLQQLAESERAWNHRLHKLRAVLASRKHTYGAGGWAPSSDWVEERVDQGQDFEIPLGQRVRAPGDGEVVGHGEDRAFPYGFGHHLIVRIDTGRFGGRTYYIGHVEGLVDSFPVGHKFKKGDLLSQTNHYLNAGWGWVELGTYPYGPMGTGWNIHGLFADVVE